MAGKTVKIKDFRSNIKDAAGNRIFDAANKLLKAIDGTTLIDLSGKLVANADIQTNQQVITGDGTVSIKSGTVFLQKGSAAAITLSPPVAGAQSAGGDDGKRITVFSETAFAHVVTCSQGFNRKGASGTATATAAANNQFTVEARNGQYNVIGALNFSFA